MISIDFESGHIFIGQTSVPVKLTDEQGYLHLNYPDGPILKPLSVLERLRLIQYALTANNAPASLAASILHEATVKPGVGDYRMYEAVALHLAGGGLMAPPIYQSISMVARNTGWHPNDIFSADAAQIDRMASALVPPSSSEWTRVLMLDAGQDELDAYTNDLAASLIGRIDDGESSDFNDAGQNQDAGHISDEVHNSPESTGDLQPSDKNALTDGSVFQKPINPRSIETGSDEPATSDPDGEYSSDDGFTLKKRSRHRQNNEETQPQSSIKSNGSPKETVEPVSNLSRPKVIKAAGGIVPVRDGAAGAGKNSEHGLTLQRHLDQAGNSGAGLDSKSTGARPERLAVPNIADDPPAAERLPPGRLRLSQRPSGSGTHDWPKISQPIRTPRTADGLDHNIAAFFGHKEASVAEELADTLNREADLRGIE